MTTKKPREITFSDIVRQGNPSRTTSEGFKYEKVDILATDALRKRIGPSYPEPAYGWPDDRRMFMISGNIYCSIGTEQYEFIELKSNINDELVRYGAILYRPTNVLVQAHHLGASTRTALTVRKDFGSSRKPALYAFAGRYAHPQRAKFRQLYKIFNVITNKPYPIITKDGVKYVWNYHNYRNYIYFLLAAENLIGSENVNFGIISEYHHFYRADIMATSGDAKKLFRKMATEFFAMRTAASQHDYDLRKKVNDIPQTITSPQMWKEIDKFHDISLGWPDIPEVQKEVKRIANWKKDVPIGYD